METIRVGMGEFMVAGNPGLLSCVGLGSCVGVVLYDPLHRIGALGHVVLPSRHEARGENHPGKFADSAIELMLSEMRKKGAKQVIAKIFGGANMFPDIEGSVLGSIGERNVLAVEKELLRHRIKIVAAEVGGHAGRTILFDTKDGSVRVRGAGGEERIY